jgi:hypothetical protein
LQCLIRAHFSIVTVLRTLKIRFFQLFHRRKKQAQEIMEFISETRMIYPLTGQGDTMNPLIRVILEGVYDNESPLSALRGTPHIGSNHVVVSVSQ